MKRFSLLLLLAAGCSSGITDTGAEYDAARRAAERWTAQHPREWSLELSGAALTPTPWSQPCSRIAAGGLVSLRFAADDTEVDLYFRCPVGGARDARELQAAFSHVALGRLPHGIRAPGWRFDVLTPSSSFSEGVVFEVPASGRMRISIETPLYAVSGRSTRPECEPPADAPMAEGCYLTREHRIPLRLRIDAAYDPSALR
jgi:hypothetical protein